MPGIVASIAYRLRGHLPVGVKLFLNRRLNATFLVGLLGVVRNETREVLVLTHTYRPGFPYGVPSGWLKRGEPLEEALAREIAEETGLTVEFVRVLAIESRERPTRLDVWLEYELVGGNFRPSPEVSEARFYPLDALPPLLREQRDFLSALPA